MFIKYKDNYMIKKEDINKELATVDKIINKYRNKIDDEEILGLLLLGKLVFKKLEQLNASVLNNMKVNIEMLNLLSSTRDNKYVPKTLDDFIKKDRNINE